MSAHDESEQQMKTKREIVPIATALIAFSVSKSFFSDPSTPLKNIFIAALIGGVFGGTIAAIRNNLKNPTARPKLKGIVAFVTIAFVLTPLVFLFFNYFQANLAAKVSHLPSVSNGSGIFEVVNWGDSGGVTFEGVPISELHKETNIKEGYQVYAGEIRALSGKPKSVECRVTNTIVLDHNVSIDTPFGAEDRACQIMYFDRKGKKAQIESNSVIFTIYGSSATWQDKTGSGPMVQVIEAALNNGKYTH